MRIVRPALCLVVLAGCGGTKSFSYSADHPATTTEQAAAAMAEQSLSAFTADTVSADAFGTMAANMYALASENVGSSSIRRDTYTDCATVTADRVDFNCTSAGATVSGHVARTGSGDSRTWDVDLTVTASDTSGGTTVNVSMHLGGNVTITPSSIDGSMSLNATVHISGNGQTIDGTLNAGVAYNHVTFDSQQGCATGGNIVVTLDLQSPQESLSRAVRYTFTGCHMINVAIGT